MIQLPQRSVTRFFIPLIDVLTLLFCIFLVLPLAKEPDDTSADVAALEERLRQTQEELDRLRESGRDAKDTSRQEKAKALQKRLLVRVLEIDAQTGRLYYRDPVRVEVRNEADAHELIERDRGKLGQKELYYLILYPRIEGSTYPTRGQRGQYDRWFEGVALGYDIPGPSGGRQP